MSRFRTGTFERKQVHPALQPICPASSAAQILDIQPMELVNRNKKLILVDVDNTLVGWRSDDIPIESIQWVNSCKEAGLHLCILSNTRNPSRLERLAKELGIDFVRGKFKPNPAVYREALNRFGVSAEDAIMIGDQLFTDILGANRAGIEAIWVRPMTGRDFVGTKISRLGERLARRYLYRSLQHTDIPAAEPELLKTRRTFEQFVKFCVVGGSSMAIDLGVHWLLMFALSSSSVPVAESLGRWLLDTFPQLFSFAKDASAAATPVLKIVSASFAIANSFYWNRRWTFEITGKEERAAQLQKFLAVSIIGMILNTIIVTALFNIIPGHPKRSWAIASLIATVAVAFWNFTGQKFFAFRKKEA